MRKHSEPEINGLAELRRKFMDGANVTEIVLERHSHSTFIVVRHGEWTAVINPIALGNSLSVDVHAFSGDTAHKARVVGFGAGTGQSLPNGHDYPLTAVIIGEDE